MKNKKGSAETLMILMILAGTVFGAIKTHDGEWGKNGTDNFEARQQALTDAGVHINNQDRWYEDMRP